MKLLIEKIVPEAKLPIRANASDAGLDLFALDDLTIPVKEWRLVRTGIKIALPTGTVGLVWDKSGLASKGLHLLAGVIDEGYRGEILVNVLNLNQKDYKLSAGQKIGQLLIQPILYPDIEEAIINDVTQRGEKGFGSSGLV